MKRPRDKGARGEREVVARFRANGYPRAARSPGSGAMRPYGAGDLSPWPGDLSFVGPWMVEVKYDERVEAGGQRTWPGSTFVKATCRDLDKLWRRHSGVVGARPSWPVLWARSNLSPWRLFIPDALFHIGMRPLYEPGEWVEIPEWYFWEQLDERFKEGG